jgi:hypothetical protein
MLGVDGEHVYRVPDGLWDEVAAYAGRHFSGAGFAFADVHRGLRMQAASSPSAKARAARQIAGTTSPAASRPAATRGLCRPAFFGGRLRLRRRASGIARGGDRRPRGGAGAIGA